MKNHYFISKNMKLKYLLYVIVMSCAGKGYGTNPQSDGYLNAQFASLTSTNTMKSMRKCRKFVGFYPSFTPVLNSLSVSSSASGSFVEVYVTGQNFLPQENTYIRFGSFGYIQPVFYSSFNLSFVVPLNATPGVYNVQVVNIYNNNFSPSVNMSYGSNLNFSNVIQYVVV